ncbi:hypothetical protein [Streptomyces filamentosus]|uniref:hypothetical protein n=1 Tax=Streptomyces filamentosus TaxID=67294 RepID=UPI003411DA82
MLTDLLEAASEQLEEADRAARLAETKSALLTERLQAETTARDAEVEDHLLTLTALERVQAENERLRNALVRQARWEELAEADQLPEVWLPASFEELWARLDTLEHIRVTADRRVALGLDEHAAARTWAAKAWSGLAALDAYGEHRKKGFVGGFTQFCKNPPAGARTYPISQVTMFESKATMGGYGDERIFSGVDGEPVEMQAHLKLAGRGNLCPRLYFLDDLAGKGASGLVIVGYVGPHLTNTRTN